jgi:hypothetical protein
MGRDSLTQLWNINHAGNEAKDTPQKTSRLLMEPEQDTGPKTTPALWWWKILNISWTSLMKLTL